MNCGQCQQSISLFLDGELDEVVSKDIRDHLTLCEPCAKVCEDLAAIVGSCQEADADSPIPPNPDALWCRINNLIESEIEPARDEPDEEAPRRWNFTFSQAAASLVGVAVISSLLTVVGIRNYFEPPVDDFTSRTAESQTTFEKVLSKVGLIETPYEARLRRLNEQQAAIDYWNKRVQQRKAMWDTRLRDAFDRNLAEIDRAVHEYSVTLENDPNDDLSGEMLDAALNEKMNLLRQFSEL